MNYYIKYLKIIPAFIAIFIGLTSCEDDIKFECENQIEGEDTTISLNLNTPSFTQISSRADMSTEDAYKVNSLWIGIYNSRSGESTLTDNGKNGLFLEAQNDHGFVAGTQDHNRHALTNIKTKSGSSYIVAVANPDRNFGFTIKDEKRTSTSLKELLENASTWDDFRSIIIERELFRGSADINIPNATQNPLHMSGIYLEESHTADFDWNTVKPYAIPLPKTNGGNVAMPGSIHLRRPFTQVKVNLQAATEENTDIKILKIEPESFVIHNVPIYSWLYERPQLPVGTAPEKNTDYANAGDALEKDAEKNTNYKSSLIYPSTNINEKDGVYSFDFWMMENKRTGRADFCTDYQDRELEWKKNDANTGVYKSLCPSETPTLNNFATYMEIRAKLTYIQKDPIVNPDGVTGLPDKVDSRTVDAVYTIHLGYVGENPDPKDFNSLRNSIYTYNVKVLTANSIIVEAFRNNEEPQPGAEGIVSDVTNKMFELDSHYNAFNIQLTETELQKFSFSMRSYYGENTYNYSIDKDGKSTGDAIPGRNDNNYRYFSWVEIVPTTGEDALAPYPGVIVGPDGTPFMKCNLNEIRENAQKLYAQSTDGWFTVFVNEYTYENETENPGVETAGNWRNYVMKPNRVAYLNVTQSVSTDKESSYYQSKYGISQKSIQTYYDYTENIQTAIGVEYDNETFGMNLRWPSGTVNTVEGGTSYPAVTTSNGVNGTLSVNNGRYNVWIGSGGRGGGNQAGNWNTYVNSGNAANTTYGKVNNVNRITNTNQTYYVKNFSADPKTWPVPQPVLLSPNSFSEEEDDDGGNKGMSSYDPQIPGNTIPPQVIHAMHACMNRNRDNNGNGVIDADELRWYLPASGKYMRVIMGRNSLREPILNYDNNPQLPFPASGDGDGNNSRLFLASSDYRTIWTTQGMSISNFATYCKSPWAVRCIRNLGVDLSTVTATAEEDPVDPAYEVELGKDDYSTGGVVRVKHYYGSSLRNYTVKPIAIHKVNSEGNMLGQYGFEIALIGNRATPQSPEADVKYRTPDQYKNSINEATPCKNLNDNLNRKGWRVPNQKELVIMMRSGAIPDFGKNNYWYFMSSTIPAWDKETPADSNKGLTDKSSTICSITQNLSTHNFEASAQAYNEINKVRCVRDLTPEEEGLSYEQIRAQQ
ncbi:hypothetical protein [uncultured Muribaculum sp.]|uniref:hypothetical protein n=1 Tax=uncultured Muribaculum sp. TaxID=1918613 RepID=UPI0026EEBC99|nr:hypothetical protein [uncultured Muribaculum sp.]